MVDEDPCFVRILAYYIRSNQTEPPSRRLTRNHSEAKREQSKRARGVQGMREVWETPHMWREQGGGDEDPATMASLGMIGVRIKK